MLPIVVLGLLFSCQKPQPFDPEKIAVIRIVAGDNQRGYENQPLASPLSVQVIDSNNAGLADVEVYFQVKRGGGQVEPTRVRTDAAGMAATRWSLGTEILQKIRVSIRDDHYETQDIFMRAKTERWVEVVIVSGDRQEGIQGEPLAEPAVVRVQDFEGNPLPNVKVGFKLIAGGGTIAPSGVVTDGSGLAEVYSTLGSGAYQQIRVAVIDDYYFAKYAFVYAQTEFKIEPLPGSRWLSGIDFVDPYGTFYPHDNRILETDNFLTFSDYNRDDIKIQFATMAEEGFRELKGAFVISSSEEVGIFTDDPDSKMTIYYAEYQRVINASWAYGFAITGITSPHYQQPDRLVNGRTTFRNTVVHETMHVLVNLLGCGVNGIYLPHVWFSEGIAEYMSGGGFTPIETYDQYSRWRENNHINPIDMRNYGDPGTTTTSYYPMYGLAVRYLLDEKGLGKTLMNVKAMLEQMTISNDFESAFAQHFGMTLDHFRQNFFDLMEDYLDIY